ncbi:MAG TPA: NADH-quinone oxidoreductase subunit C [Actinomycetota bacterium]|nr:NADH-quinone oxidoreductase subunit C [Actinomycetota bacterium]
MDERLTTILAQARERFPEHVSEPVEQFGEVSIDVAREALRKVVRVLRVDGPFEMLADWSAVDYYQRNPAERRFLCAAHLASAKHPLRVRLRVWIPEGDPTCPSLVGEWPGANFPEREIYDFFGIVFEGHPDMRRIFMPDEWEGHPQRKDYPLGGVNVEYHHGSFIPPPDTRGQGATTTGYPGRIS